MKAINFAYYLRGSFELQNVENNTAKPILTRKQADHLLILAESVDKGPTQDNIESKAQNLVSFATGILTLAKSSTDSLEETSILLSKELNKFFKEVVAPSTQPTQSSGFPSRPPGVRC